MQELANGNDKDPRQSYANKKDESTGKGCSLYNQGMERGDKEKYIRKRLQDLTNRRITGRNEGLEEQSDSSEEKVDTNLLLERKIK